jgi:hypothetical protein
MIDSLDDSAPSSATALIPGLSTLQGGAVAVLGLVALMIFMGWLVPIRTINQMRKDFEEVRKDRDYWRQAAMKSMGHTDALMPVADIATQMSQAFHGTVPSDEGSDPS